MRPASSFLFIQLSNSRVWRGCGCLGGVHIFRPLLLWNEFSGIKNRGLTVTVFFAIINSAETNRKCDEEE